MNDPGKTVSAVLQKYLHGIDKPPFRVMENR